MTVKTLANLLNQLGDRVLARTRVALPCRVETYYPATQTVDAQPLLTDQYTNQAGELATEKMPLLVNVPVAFPAGGGMRITFPIAQGDAVLVVFTDRSIDEWQASGNPSDPQDYRRHDLSDGIAIPGLHSNASPWSEADTGVITLGSDSGSSDFVALSSKVTALMNKIANHVHAGVTTGTGTSGTSATLMAMDTNVASGTVKIKG